MIPPTSIDGTDITGATIDGTEVTEITVDGQTVFEAGPTGFAQRADDNQSGSSTNANGIKFETKALWPDIEFEISNNVSGLTRARIFESDGSTIVDTITFSSAGSGDVIEFTGVDLPANNQFYIIGDNQGNSYNTGRIRVDQGALIPASTSANVDIINGASPDGGFGAARDASNTGNFLKVGNIP